MSKSQIDDSKTSYSKKKLEKLEIPFLSKDAIKEVLYDSLDCSNLNYE